VQKTADMANLDNRERRKAAIIGSLVADAAVNPMHWVYNVDTMTNLLENNDAPEFRKEWACPFYVQATGSFSCYGDQNYCLLKSLAQNQGFDLKAYVKDQYAMFGPGSKYKANPGRDGMPKQGGWINGNISRSLDNLKQGNELAGSDEAESDSFSKVISIIALYAGNDCLNEKIEQAVRTTLNNDKAVRTAQYYGRLLEECILTGSYDVMKWYEALPECDVKDEIKIVFEKKDLDHRAAAKELGIACSLPGSFQCTIDCLLKCNDNFTDAVRMALSAGGGNCARSIAVGALLAAKHGIKSIPETWVARTTVGKEVVELAEKVIVWVRVA